MPTYLDCNATTPIDPKVLRLLILYTKEEYGNAGSRTHEFGVRAKKAVQLARDQIAAVVQAGREEVIFTSGATESNNLAILGLAENGEKAGRKHVISTRIEHKAVIEPVEALIRRGFSVTWIEPNRHGRVNPEDIRAALRPETNLVSIMAANNETGVIQPIAEIGQLIGKHPAYFHSDGAQAFGKDIEGLKSSRLDLISISGHKIYAPKGIGALVVRRRGYKQVPLRPISFGGGQERGLRAGTLPVASIVGLGEAANLSVNEHNHRMECCREIQSTALQALASAGGVFVGDREHTLPTTVGVRFPGLDSEALMVAMKDVIAISNGSACTSSTYSPSHVLKAMGYDDKAASEFVRFSWCHLTPAVDWTSVAERIRNLRGRE